MICLPSMEIAPPSSLQVLEVLHVPMNYFLFLLACKDIYIVLAAPLLPV